jgi:enoyl-CoA hydratase/carnithine racemase
MEAQHLIYSEEDKVGTISINEPDKRNALSLGLLRELTSLLEGIGEEKTVKALIIRGRGKHFSSGHDLGEVRDWQPQEVRSLFRACFRAMRAIREIPQPVVAQVHGVATAAGCQLAAACDLAVASEDARFGTPGVKIGLFCTTPAVFLSRSIGRKKAMEMLLTGELISAEEALRHGLVNRVVPAEELDSTARGLAEQIAGYSLHTLGLGKNAFYRQINMEDFQALDYATEVISLNSASRDAMEGISAFLEKREPQWRD